jgi:hypoxanthine-guanine phosphoribosyltransferase
MTMISTKQVADTVQVFADAIIKTGVTMSEAGKRLSKCREQFATVAKILRKIVTRRKEIKILTLKELTLGLTHNERKRLYGEAPI